MVLLRRAHVVWPISWFPKMRTRGTVDGHRGSGEKEGPLTLAIGRHAGHARALHHARRHALHHLGIGARVEAALGSNAGILLLLLVVHHLLPRLLARLRHGRRPGLGLGM